MRENVLYKQKTLADYINIGFLILGFALLTLLLGLIALMGVIVYPLCALLIYGIQKIRQSFIKRDKKRLLKIIS